MTRATLRDVYAGCFIRHCGEAHRSGPQAQRIIARQHDAIGRTSGGAAPDRLGIAVPRRVSNEAVLMTRPPHALDPRMIAIHRLIESIVESRVSARAPQRPTVPVGPKRIAEALRAIQRLRRSRAMFLPDLFADPAWDMLIDLVAATIEGKTVSVSSLCIAAAVPPTTALRHIDVLIAAGCMRRRPDDRDGRRILIDPDPAIVEAMSLWTTRAIEALA